MRSYDVTGSVPEYRAPFEEEVGTQATLEAMQECVVIKKMRPRLQPSWFTHAVSTAALMLSPSLT